MRYVGAVEESIKLRDESVLCQAELKNLCFQEASNGFVEAFWQAEGNLLSCKRCLMWRKQQDLSDLGILQVLAMPNYFL